MKEILIGGGLVALIDDSDFALVSRFSWHVGVRPTNRYARTEARCIDGKRRHFFMHRMIMGFPGIMTGIDHKNGNGLDNRRENLRAASQRENLQNRHRTWGSSRFKGASFRKDTKRWSAYITISGKRKCLGCFDSERDAGLVYDSEAKKAFGAFARLNFV